MGCGRFSGVSDSILRIGVLIKEGMNVLCRFIGPEDENPNYHIVVWMKGWKDERMNEWINVLCRYVGPVDENPYENPNYPPVDPNPT